MASQQPQPPAPASTTMNDLGDDLLREIFLYLPDLPSLVRAAFACRAFRRAVASSPAFRRSFRALHPPPLIALFLEPNMDVVPVFSSPCNRPDPGLLAADFFGTRCVSRPRATGWEIQYRNPSTDGYLILMMTGSHKRRAAYNPLMQALDLLLYQPDISFQFDTLSSEDGQGPSHVVCVRPQHPLAETTAYVFSSETMEWQISRKASLRLPEPDNDRVGLTCMVVVRGLMCWRSWTYDRIVLFDAATYQFSLIELPRPLRMESSKYKLGETKDGKFCVADILENTLVSWFLPTTTDDSVAGRWTMYRKFSLDPIVNKFTGCSIHYVGVDLMALIDGFVYLSFFYSKDTKYFEMYLSVCLETSEISDLFNGAFRHHEEAAHPYVLPCPPSLVQSKEESETGFMGDIVAGPVGTKEASTVLLTALQSFRQALMNDCDSNSEIVAQLDAFLGPSEDDESPLISKMTTLDAQLRTARDRILRISA